MAFTCDYQATPMPSPTLRTTLGTQLARAGVAPQITQRIMRHADFRTTNRHRGFQTGQKAERNPGGQVGQLLTANTIR